MMDMLGAGLDFSFIEQMPEDQLRSFIQMFRDNPLYMTVARKTAKQLGVEDWINLLASPEVPIDVVVRILDIVKESRFDGPDATRARIAADPLVGPYFAVST